MIVNAGPVASGLACISEEWAGLATEVMDRSCKGNQAIRQEMGGVWLTQLKH